MSCSDPTKNIDAKQATYDTLNNIYKFTNNNYFKPNSIEKPFPSEPDKSIYENINTDLDNSDNSDNSENKKNLFIKDNITTNIYQNCAIQVNNPWFTTSSDYKKCEIINDIILDDKLKYSADKTVINLNLKSKNKSKTAFCPYFKNVNKAYCENRWYDWIVTPNYYLGNTYFKDNSKFGENDVYKCFKPCDGDTMPYRTNKGINKCIPKKYFGNGIFANKLMFSPIGLINLIGHVAIMNDTDINTIQNKNLLYKLYKLILDYNISNKMDDTIYKTNNVYDNIDTLLPDFDIIYQEFKTSINDNILKGDKFNTNDKQEYKYINDLTYKNRNFNEDEPEMYTLKGLDTCEALIPPILHHTWILANIFKPLQEDYIEKFPPTDSIKEQNNKLYDRLKTVFNDVHKALRLTNIFFKAVNVCYNNKSNFSINIIDKTKKTFDKYKDNYKTILGLYSFVDAEITNIYSSDNPIFNNEYKYYLDYELNNIKEKFVINANDDVKKTELAKLGNLRGYFYSQELLEAPTCGKGKAFNSKIGECEEIIEEPIIDKNAPVEDEMDAFNIPEIKNILYMFLQIILVIVILYIIYIFYDIFGETIFTVLNYLYMKSYEMYVNTNVYISGIFTADEENYQKIKADADYSLVNTQYANLKQNTLKISSYMNEHNIHKNANV